MDIDIYKTKIQNIIKNSSAENVAEITKETTELQEAYIQEQTLIKSLEESNASLQKSVESLRQQTLDLLLKSGAEVKTTSVTTGKKENKKASFEDLFNEKGELK